MGMQGCSECTLLPAVCLRIRLLLSHISRAVFTATPQGFACSTAFCFLCLCFSSVPKFLSVPTHLHFNLSQQQGGQACRWLLALFRTCWRRFGEHGDKALDAACAGLSAVTPGAPTRAPHGSRGRSSSPSGAWLSRALELELHTCRNFLRGAIQRKPPRAAPIGQDSSPANRGLQKIQVVGR